MHTNKHPASSGFTLIEMSIVLVVTGLIIGGIVIGRNLIKAAETRATIKQKTSYDLAVNAFKLKYDYLPGDMPPSQASPYGFFAITAPYGSVMGYPNGNGFFSNAGDTAIEHLIFWRHLSEALLIDGIYGANPSNPLNPATGFPTAAETAVANFLPPSKLSENVFFIPVSANGKNYYWLTGVTNIPMGVSFSGIYKNALSPDNLYSLDSKLDDGLPNSGAVLGFGSYSATASNDVCLTGGTGGNMRYNINPGSGGEEVGPANTYNPSAPTGSGKVCFLFLEFLH